MKRRSYLWIVALALVVAVAGLTKHATRSQSSLLPNASVMNHQLARSESTDEGRERYSSSQIHPATEESPLSNNTMNTVAKREEGHLVSHSNSTERASGIESETENRSTPGNPAELLLEPEIAQASVEFKQNSELGLRPKPARKLLPHLKKGMSKTEVKALLGEPSKVSDDGLFWGYIVFYSQFIDIYFDSHDRIGKIDACVTTNIDHNALGQAE